MLTEYLFFTHPLALFLTMSLPILWVLFKLLPLKPLRVVFPAMVLFNRKKADAPAPRDIPFWLKLIRLLTALFLILFLASPVYDRGGESVTFEPSLFIIDNSWSSAVGWQDRIDAVSSRIDSFINVVSVPIAIVTTAPDADTGKPMFAKDLTPAEAKTFIKSIKPQPWNSDYNLAGLAVKEYLFETGYKWNSFWFSDGQGGTEQDRFLDAVSSYGDVSVYHTPAYNQGIIISDVSVSDQDMSVKVMRRNADAKTIQTITVFGAGGDVISRQKIELAKDIYESEEKIRLPLDVIRKVQRIQLSPDTHAASVWYMDKSWQQPKVGIWTDRTYTQKQDYLNDVFYIAQAVNVSSEVITGPLSDLLKDKDMSMIILPDSTQPDTQDYQGLKSWVETGGTLLRFAGDNLVSENTPQLLPVKIYGGERNFGGAMSWDTPAKLGGLAEGTPLSSLISGLTSLGDFTINQQVLARPAIDLEEKSWAWIEDQSPLITHAEFGKGNSILVHTSADTSWSDMAISEFFPVMMSSLSRYSLGAASGGSGDLLVYPSRVYDAYGRLSAPGFLAEPILTLKMAETVIGPKSPMGLYAAKGLKDTAFVAYNYGYTEASKNVLQNAIDLDFFERVLTYDEKTYVDLSLFFLWASIVFFLMDCLFTLVLIHGRKVLRLPLSSKTAQSVLFAILLFSAPAYAEDAFKNEIDLAYVITNDSNRDAISRKGLQALGNVLRQRTTVEFNQVSGVNPDVDELSKYPFIYWPLTASQSNLSEMAQKNIQSYLDHGGLILFDTRDAQFEETDSSLGQESLRQVMQGIQVGPLVVMPEDHVLKRSYYLLEDFPGLYKGRNIWVEDVAETDYDGVPTVVIGDHDWAAAWSSANTNRFPVGLENSKKNQFEHSLRFGVNMVMMALTGSYKKDQVHVKYILERFDRD